MTSIVYLGHKISDRGIEPLQEKIQAILEMPGSKTLSDVQAHLGHVEGGCILCGCRVVVPPKKHEKS